ncbi:MAG: RHS repeat protein, partial [Deltaproteobacteria bacterium]|nr:RHS repeat protein [Deltaproteobacteria bacterium]
DELNRIIRTTYPDGTVVEYTYDAKGNCLSVIKGNPSSPTAPTVQITAAPASIQPGETATLSWTSSNADSCSIDQGIGGDILYPPCPRT